MITIVGAGLTGITLAQQLKDCVILEKSRGVGGRLAARRLGSYSLNHGPHEIYNPSNSELIKDPHSWIKNEAEGLTIHKSWEVSHLEIFSGGIRAISHQGQMVESRKIILTVPAPQAQLILKRSGITADFLVPVRYKKVIQFMLLSDSITKTDSLNDYLVSKTIMLLEEYRYLTLYELKEHHIEEFFEKDPEEIKKFLLDRTTGLILDSHVHKWRYSEVISPIGSKFQTIFRDKNIFLAGDYFGVNGIMSSCQSVKEILPLL